MRIARIGEEFAVDVGAQEPGDHVVRRIVGGAVFVDQALDVGAELGVRVRQTFGCTTVLRFEQLVGPDPETFLVGDGDPDHVRDHRRRQRIHHLGDEVDRLIRPRPDCRGDESLRLGPDERLGFERAMGRDHGVDHSADAAVAGFGNGGDHHVVLGQRARVHERPDELLDVVQPGRHPGGTPEVVTGGGLDDPAVGADPGHRRETLRRTGRVRIEGFTHSSGEDTGVSIAWLTE